MLIKRPADIAPSEITAPEAYFGRRQFLRNSAGAMLVATVPGLAWAPPTLAGTKLAATKNPKYVVDAELTPHKYVTGYNNFYEFGTGKEDPAENAQDFVTKPWSVVVDGACGKPGTYNLEDVIRPADLEERIYRFRCVEAWSMVVPWIGVPLATVLKRFEPASGAKYVAFETLHDPEQMPGQKRGFLDWPYVEGLRIDEAMHPLALLTVGLYGEEIPNQNGAPIRLMVPWKYGFKSIKSIVKISFTDKEPPTTWNKSAPREYGFYSNVNPAVNHPRWSQAKERKVGAGFFTSKIPTLPFNGYGDEVASLYTGMDLAKFY
jgi:methionine sulfoxide reductase catalytic subunit